MKRSKILAMMLTIIIVLTVCNFAMVKTKATDDAIKLNYWTFKQGGMYNPNLTEGDEGYIGSVTMNDTNEVIDGWLKGSGEEDAPSTINQTQTASQLSTGFVLDIDNTGWDAQWDTNPRRINPWSIQASMNDVDIMPGHEYTVSFKAKASKKKYCYVEFGCEMENVSPYGEDVARGNNQLIVLDTTERTYTYTFINWVEASYLTTTLWLGAFNSQYDFNGNDVSDIITKEECQWNGTVYVSDFTITDNAQYICTCTGKPTKPEETTTATEIETTTVEVEEPTEAVTTTIQKETSTSAVKLAKTKVNKATKARASKKIKISLKKIKGVTGYQIQISKKKNFNTVMIKKKVNKISFTVSSKKVKRLKKIYVRARVYNKNNGKYYYGKWSKVKKVKIK